MSELEDLQKKLYEKGASFKQKEHKLPPSAKKIEVGWQEEEGKKPKKPGSAFSIIALIALIIIAISAFFIYKWYSVSGEIAINIIGPIQVRAGEPTSYKINIKNNLSSTLQNAQLSITLGDNVTFLNNIGTKFAKFSIGNLTVNQDANQEIQVIFTGAPNSVTQITATVDYGLQNLSGSFERSNNLSIEVGSQTVQADFTLPQKVLSGRPFTFSFRVQNLTSGVLSAVDANMNFPDGLSITNSDIQPSQGNNWQFANLNPGETRVINFTGIFSGDTGNTSKTFSSDLFLEYQQSKIQLQSISENLTIQPFPIYLGIELQNNGTTQPPSYIAKPGDVITYIVKFKNTENVTLENSVIKVKLQSPMFDFSTLQTNGAYSSIDNTITFNAANTQILSNFAPGLEGSVSFNIRLLTSYPIKTLNNKNFIIAVNAELSSTTIPPDIGITEKILTIDTTSQNKVSGSLSLIPKIVFYDPNSFIINSGPIPLKANQPTTFTAHWLLKAYADDFSNIFIKTFLPGDVVYTGKSSNAQGYQFTYNDRTQELDIQIPTISADTGVVNYPLDIAFQIQVTPNSNQINHTIPLLNEIDVTAANNYTSQSVSLAVPSKGSDTLFLDDSHLPQNAGLVQP